MHTQDSHLIDAESVFDTERAVLSDRLIKNGDILPGKIRNNVNYYATVPISFSVPKILSGSFDNAALKSSIS